MSSSAEYAVFTEFSPDNKQALAGWNRRVFTDTDVRKGATIQCDFTTGIVTLAPGAYHISGLSMVAYFTSDDPPETIVPRSPASAGYCRLRSVDPQAAADPASLRELPNSDAHIITIGSPSTANLVPTCSRPSTKPTSRRRSCWSISRDRSPTRSTCGSSSGTRNGMRSPASASEDSERTRARERPKSRPIYGRHPPSALSCECDHPARCEAVLESLFMADMQAGIGPVFGSADSWHHRGAANRALGRLPGSGLDGIGAGQQRVALPGLVACILNGTGRVNVGQGSVMTREGLGAALSPAIGGGIAQRLGYPAAFLILGGIALGSIAIWLGFAPLLKACLRRQARGRRRRVRCCRGGMRSSASHGQ
jgi:hypothetical protein